MPIPLVPGPSFANKQAVVYGLLNPISNELFYVGVTTKKYLCNRLSSHVNDSGHLNMPGDRYERIREILRAGRRPEIFEIESVPVERWAEAEEFWIGYFKFVGANLTNKATGGPGNSGTKHTEETRKRIREAAVGRDMSACHTEAAREIAASKLRNTFVVDGVTYHGLKKTAAALGIPYSTFRYRIKTGVANPLERYSPQDYALTAMRRKETTQAE